MITDGLKSFKNIIIYFPACISEWQAGIEQAKRIEPSLQSTNQGNTPTAKHGGLSGPLFHAYQSHIYTLAS